MKKDFQKVIVNSPSRLHFGLIDLSGKNSRIDGGVGLSIQEPSMQIEIFKSNRLIIHAPTEFTSTIKTIVSKMSEIVHFSNYHINLTTNSKAHYGFGSGTQVSLTLGFAICELMNYKKMSIYELASFLGRGGTSGIGINSFSIGGFIVDAGRKWPEEKSQIGPSSIFNLKTQSTLISRLDFPNWDICIITPKNKDLIHGKREVDLFDLYTPISIDDVNILSKIILLEILPSIINKDFSGFCKALERYQQYGLKKFEIQTIKGIVEDCIVLLKDLGLKGIGLSSWGPTIFAFTDDKDIRNNTEKTLENSMLIENFFFTKASNNGFTIKKV